MICGGVGGEVEPALRHESFDAVPAWAEERDLELAQPMRDQQGTYMTQVMTSSIRRHGCHEAFNVALQWLKARKPTLDDILKEKQRIILLIE